MYKHEREVSLDRQWIEFEMGILLIISVSLIRDDVGRSTAE